MIKYHTVELDQIPVYYGEVAGDGTPLVLLHGITGSHASYVPLVPALPVGTHAFMLDFRGHGQSGHGLRQYRVPDYADDVLQFIRKVVGSPAIVAGHSLGALVAACAASMDSSAFRGIFLEDPPMYFPLRPDFTESEFYDYFTALRTMLDAHHARGGTVADLQAIVGNEPADDGRTMLEAYGEDTVRERAEFLQSMDPRLLDPAIDGSLVDGFDPDRDLPRITCRAHLLAGNDALGGAMTEEDVERTVAHIPRCTYRVFPDAGHGIQVEKPHDYVRELHQFMAEVA